MECWNQYARFAEIIRKGIGRKCRGRSGLYWLRKRLWYLLMTKTGRAEALRLFRICGTTEELAEKVRIGCERGENHAWQGLAVKLHQVIVHSREDFG